MTIRSFGDAARVAAEQETEHVETLTVDILGREIDIEYPGSGQVIYMTAELSEAQNDISQIGGLIQFIYHLVSPEDAQYIRQRLLDRMSGFDAEAVLDLVEYLVEEWSSRPTEKPSVSSPSPRKAGSTSTGGARRKVSTSSNSRSGGSSTSSTARR